MPRTLFTGFILALVLATGCLMARRRDWVRADCQPYTPIERENDSQACLVEATAALGGAPLAKDRLYQQCMRGKGWRVQQCGDAERPAPIQ